MAPCSDLNVIISSEERKGRAKNRVGIDHLFLDILFDNCLLDMGFKGPGFTCSQASHFQHLDKFICYIDWMNSFPDSSVAHLQHIGSDHKQICLSTSVQTSSINKIPFCFISARLEHDQFDSILKDSWALDADMVTNINNFSSKIKEWNFSSFDHISTKKKVIMARLKEIEERLDRYPSSFQLNLEKQLRSKLEEVLTQ
ncbi:hypothetical protein GOBAR_DD10289 [Gossypium barbadense]|nr:hypothetical protein GOBAR_DD10289 [Gossypium barbadense]